jgi:rod shape-determining protein MreD
LEILLAFPILTILTLFQTAIASRVFLLHGSPDLVLLVILAWALQERVTTAWHWAIIGSLLVSIPSAQPVYATIAGYLLATGVTVLLKKRVWQVPFFAMSIATIVGTFLNTSITWLVLILRGHPLPMMESLNLVILPSVLLNLLLSFVVFTLVSGLAEQVFPETITT